MAGGLAAGVAGSVLARRMVVATPKELAMPAVVVAPHPDDETLGCGALIAAKRRRGAEVGVVFLTDGAASHPRFGADRLRALRREEGLAACSMLGVAAADVTFLDFPDGHLHEHVEGAAASVRRIISERRPAELFVTGPTDPHRDHRAASRVVAAARRGVDPRVREYPIWQWNHWPWVRWSDVGRDDRGRLTPGIWRRSLALLPQWRRYDWSVPIGDLEPTKRAALACHASQMARLGGDDWFVLGDVSGGRFLECFFRGDERFTGGAVRPG